MELYDWAKHYIKFKDCMKKKIKELVLEEGTIIAKEKEEEKTYFIAENIKEIITKINFETTTYLVCLNTKANIDTIYKEWKELITKPKLTIICAEPNSNESWSIHPSTHHKIAENIKEGLQTLYDNITPAD